MKIYNNYEVHATFKSQGDQYTFKMVKWVKTKEGSKSSISTFDQFAELMVGRYGDTSNKFGTFRTLTVGNETTRSITYTTEQVINMLKYAAVESSKAKVSDEKEVEDALNDVMTVFKYVEDKDVFQKFYSKMLAKRLVNQTSASDDAEVSMISKLKEACGYEYTTKLQRMFTDMSVSSDLNNNFKDAMLKNHDKDDLLDFSIYVLNTASWPFNASSTTFNLPDDLVKTYDRFQRFYQNKHNGRKLNWHFALSKGELKASFSKASKIAFTFQVSTFQMGILLQYNNATSYTFAELLNSTGLSPEMLTSQLTTVCKAKVLLVTNGKLGDESSKYELNEDFKSKKVRLNLNIPGKAETKRETEETHKTIDDDRNMYIQ
ncbi:hypothetical protein HDV05_007143, partial [Chytridiales sp. JEL 0842]